ncbi:hypothetical protein MASR2M8_13200 [Opitutaceae bacterium]
MGPETFQTFLKLGVEHIITGYDHLLFLAALLIVSRRWQDIVAVVTSFTVAHSITLALASLDIVSLPGSVVEPLIAASIVWVGIENIWRRGEPKARWVAVFAFGLLHGFGFAGVLRELGLGSDGQGLALPLFSFNLGVELGQIALVMLAMPFLHWARKSPQYDRRAQPVLSGLVALMGLYWLIERTLL